MAKIFQKAQSNLTEMITNVLRPHGAAFKSPAALPNDC